GQPCPGCLCQPSGGFHNAARQARLRQENPAMNLSRFVNARRLIRRTVLITPAMLLSLSAFAGGEWFRMHKDPSNNAVQANIAPPLDLNAPVSWSTGPQTLLSTGAPAIYSGMVFDIAQYGAATFADANDDSTTLKAFSI